MYIFVLFYYQMESISHTRGMSLLEYVARLFLWVEKLFLKEHLRYYTVLHVIFKDSNNETQQ